MQDGNALKLVNAAYWLMLAMWFGALVMTGMTAGMAFSTMEQLDVQVPSFAAYDGAHHRIAAGQLMDKVFFLNDVIQYLSVIVVAAIFGLHITVFRMPWRRFSNLLRAATIAIAMGMLSYHLMVLAPRMNGNLREHWRLAEAGEDVTAVLAAFEVDHKTAELLMKIMLAVIIVLVTASASALTTRGEGELYRSGRSSTGPPLEDPELLNKRP